LSYQEIFDCLPPASNFHEKDLNINLSFRYNKINEEYPILFLHGFNGNSRSWAYQFNHFEDKRSILALDAPGFGKSDPVDIDMLKIAELVKKLLVYLNIKKCDLVGHSMGGMLAQIVASQNNDLVNKVILSCTHKGYALPKGTPLREAYKLRLDQRKKMSNREFGELRVKKMLPDLKDEKIFQFLSNISEEITEESIMCGGMAMQTLDTTEYLLNIKQACLILKGSNDVVVSEERSHQLEKLLPHAKIRVLQNVGHAPYCENATLFNSEIENFLQ